MSRIGKKPIEIPSGVEVKIEGRKISIVGPKGELSFNVPMEIKAEIKEGKIEVLGQKQNSNLFGTSRAIIANLIKGVIAGYEKKLQMEGIGYRAELQGKDILLHVGFSHSVPFLAPEGIQLKIEKNVITISGIDKQKVGETAARIRSIRKPEPYKGTGIKYIDEIIKKKAGKKAVETTG